MGPRPNGLGVWRLRVCGLRVLGLRVWGLRVWGLHVWGLRVWGLRVRATQRVRSRNGIDGPWRQRWEYWRVGRR